MTRRLLTLIVFLIACASEAAGSETCPKLPKAPEIGPAEESMLPKITRRVPATRLHILMPQGLQDTIRIKLTRANCRGACEVNSSVEIRGNGQGIYRGTGFYLLVKGEHRFPVPSSTVACLMEAFRAADVWSFASSYVVDAPQFEVVTLEIEIAGRRKVVKDRLGVRIGAPAVLGQLELAVEAAGAQSFMIGDPNTVPLLRAERFDFHARAGAVLLNAAANQSPDDVVLAILAEGAPANQKVAVNGFDDDAAIIVSARRGKLDLVRALVAAGAFADAPYQMREDALRAAIEDARPSVVAELIKDGADLHVDDAGGGYLFDRLVARSLTARSMGDLTFQADRVAVIKLLLSAGATIPRTLMFDARTPEEVRLFLAAGADLEARDSEGLTPLLRTSDEDVAIALLEAGADRAVQGQFGETLLKEALAKHLPMPRVLKWLRRHPAHPL